MVEVKTVITVISLPFHVITKLLGRIRSLLIDLELPTAYAPLTITVSNVDAIVISSVLPKCPVFAFSLRIVPQILIKILPDLAFIVLEETVHDLSGWVLLRLICFIGVAFVVLAAF